MSLSAAAWTAVRRFVYDSLRCRRRGTSSRPSPSCSLSTTSNGVQRRPFGVRRFTAALGFLFQETKAAVKRRTPNTVLMSATVHILVVDDEPIIRESLAEVLTQEGYAVTACGSAEEALGRARQTRFDLALCDVQLPGMDGLELLDRLLKIAPDTLVLLITAYGTVENAVAAFQRGAHDYLMKPILLDEVIAKVRRLLEYRKLSLDNQWLRRELNRGAEVDFIIGHSAAMKRLMEVVRKVAPTSSTVLLVGESGTGKEVLARALHRQAKN